MVGRRRYYIQRSLLLTRCASWFYAFSSALLSWRHRFAVSWSCHIDRQARVIGWSSIEFGRNVVVGTGSFLNVNHRHGKRKTLLLGDNCFIGRHNCISVGKSVRFGAYCLTGERCSFVCATHIAEPRVPYLATGATSEDEIIIGANCFFGYGASVLGNVRIGHGCIVGAHTLVRTDIPPFSIVVGNPARIVNRFDFISSAWRSDWQDTDLPHPDEEEYLSSLRVSQPWLIQPISVATSGLGDI